jgi:3-methylcrotonyl-CoA carboxylase alpha subunit
MAIQFEIDGGLHDVIPQRLKPELTLSIDGAEHRVSLLPDLGNGRRRMLFDGQEIAFVRCETAGGAGVTIRLHGRSHRVIPIDPFAGETEAGSARDDVIAPMPGIVIAIACAAGEAVSKGQALVSIESMKLQQSLVAPRDGTVAQIRFGEGASFEKDAVLVQLEQLSGE